MASAEMKNTSSETKTDRVGQASEQIREKTVSGNNEHSNSSTRRQRRPRVVPAAGLDPGGREDRGTHRHLLLRAEPVVPQGLQGLVSLQGQGPQHHLLVSQPLLRLLELGSDLGKCRLVTLGAVLASVLPAPKRQPEMPKEKCHGDTW